MLIIFGMPEAFDMMPMAMAMGIYPNAIGMPAFAPFLNSDPLFKYCPSRFF